MRWGAEKSQKRYQAERPMPSIDSFLDNPIKKDIVEPFWF